LAGTGAAVCAPDVCAPDACAFAALQAIAVENKPAASAFVTRENVDRGREEVPGRCIQTPKIDSNQRRKKKRGTQNSAKL
jgi:hypothetical protein